MTLPSQRGRFAIPDHVAYLNCAYLSPNLDTVAAAGEAAIARTSRPWEVQPRDFFTDAERARDLFARLVDGDADGVALVPSASYGVGLAAANLPASHGQRIVVLAEQFPSNLYPWREAADRAGAEVVVVERHPDGWTAAVTAAIDERTAVVAVPNVHWADGSLVDLVEVGDATRSVGAALVVDATQSLGAMPLSLRDVRPDVLVAAGYKWLLGPYSYGFAWFAPDRREGVPLEFNWLNRAGSEDFAGLVDYVDDYQEGARRYDVGERSNFVLLPMALAALEQLLTWGVDEVAATIAEHTGEVERRTRELGLDPIPAGHRGPHLLGVRIPGGRPAGLPERLAGADVYVSVRGDSLRVAPHVWTTPDDLDRLLDVLATSL